MQDGQSIGVDSDLGIIAEVADLLTVGSRVFVSELAAATHHGATPAQLRLLQLVAMHPGITVSEVADSFAITAASASTALGRSTRKGWTTKSPDPADARCFHFDLSAAGREVLTDYLHIQNERIGPLLQRFTKDEITTFRDLVVRVTRRITEMHG